MSSLSGVRTLRLVQCGTPAALGARSTRVTMPKPAQQKFTTVGCAGPMMKAWPHRPAGQVPEVTVRSRSTSRLGSTW